MQPDLPWNVSGISAQAREAARAAARREGLSIGEWLSRRIVAAEPSDAPTEEWQSEIRQTAEATTSAVQRIADALQLLTERVDALATAPAPAADGTPDTRMDILAQQQADAFVRIETQMRALAERLNDLERQPTQAGASAANAAPMEDIRKTLETLTAHVSRTAAQSDGRVTTLSDSFVSLSGSMDRLRRDFREAMTELDGHLSAFADRLQDVETTFAEDRPDGNDADRDDAAEPGFETRREPTASPPPPQTASKPVPKPAAEPAHPDVEPAPAAESAPSGHAVPDESPDDEPAPKDFESPLRAQLPGFALDDEPDGEADDDEAPRHRGRIVLMWVLVLLLAAVAGFGWYAAEHHLSVNDIRALLTPTPARPAAPAPAAAAPQADLHRLEALANAGNPKAMLLVGLKYADGDGVDADDSLAQAWLARAADAGEPVAQYRLGVLFERKDAGSAKAVELFTDAAQKGNVQAMYLLGSAYAAGAGAPKDYAVAARWFRQAADQGLSDAAFNLAGLYETGRGLAASPADAYKWYAVAAAEGDNRAATHLPAVADKLSDKALAAAKAAAAAFRPIPADPAANRVPAAGSLSAQ